MAWNVVSPQISFLFSYSTTPHLIILETYYFNLMYFSQKNLYMRNKENISIAHVIYKIPKRALYSYPKQ